ncbi:MAG TPA: rod shape-determining protein MreD [Aggregatilinea sp.]|jgi:rod shape-determining protein MreD|uniref:rod shape-determining protein MreD n=1 Tax=Aggregatilinea sp. TaxID=2806333 RepID=UPI002BCFCA75|nr:rod shape-determining protein MreD [Aggregatilinea sp.]HML24046.1 rod shape-determining protein MreD [Aggregatilinea sp.]
MAGYIGIPILMIAAVLNATVMPEFRIGGGAPDLVLILVVSWALLADVREAMLWSVVGGVLQDWLSVAPLGTSALGLVIVVFAADAVFGQISRNNIIVPPLVAAAGTVVYHLIILSVLWVVGINVPIDRGLSYVTIPAMFYNALLIIPVFRLMGRVSLWLHPRRTRVG